MTTKEIALTIKMLDAYGERLSCAGCNDTPRDWLESFTGEDLVEMDRQYHEMNGDPDEHEESKALPNAGFLLRMANARQTPQASRGRRAAAEMRVVAIPEDLMIRQFPLVGA